MRVLVFYDLPFYDEQKIRDYSRFRSSLIKNGFKMIQFSIYSKLCINEESAKTALKQLKTYLPSEGKIRTMTITENQYQKMEILKGGLTMSEQILTDKKLIII